MRVDANKEVARERAAVMGVHVEQTNEFFDEAARCVSAHVLRDMGAFVAASLFRPGSARERGVVEIHEAMLLDVGRGTRAQGVRPRSGA